mgnify:CR=1 FL=1
MGAGVAGNLLALDRADGAEDFHIELANLDGVRAALGEEMLATDLADYLVQKGMPFRQAHRRGRIFHGLAAFRLLFPKHPLPE